MSYEKTQDAVKKSLGAAEDTKESGKGLIDAAKGFADAVFNQKKAEVKAVGTAIGETAQNIGNGVANTAENVKDNAVNGAKNAWGAITAKANEIGDTVNDKIEDGKDFIAKKQDEFQAGAEELQANAREAKNNFWARVENVARSQQDMPSETMQAAENTNTEHTTETTEHDHSEAATKTESQPENNSAETETKTEAETETTTDSANDEKAEAERLDKLFQDTLAGKYGNGEERKEALGDDYETIRSRINEHYAQKAQTELDIDSIATPTQEASVELGN